MKDINITTEINTLQMTIEQIEGGDIEAIEQEEGADIEATLTHGYNLTRWLTKRAYRVSMMQTGIVTGVADIVTTGVGDDKIMTILLKHMQMSC